MGDAGKMGAPERPVFFFDIDNCLYSRNRKVHDTMHVLINQFFVKHLELSEEDANTLHTKYYTEYGLAIEGLTRFHKVDPIEFNREVDDALPLERLLKPDPRLRKLLFDIDTTKVKLWLFTNAFVTHGQRVVKILGIDDLFEGMTYCDYSEFPMKCKPHAAMFDKAETEAGASSSNGCYFVDDSYINVKGAHARGWSAVQILEPEDPEPAQKASKYQIRSLEELRTLFPQFFKTTQIYNDFCSTK